MYRGELSVRRLGVLIRNLPAESALAAALNDGKPRWSTTDHLIADLWALIFSVHSPNDTLPADFDHPARAEMTAKAVAAAKKALKAVFNKRKGAYAANTE